MPEQYKMVAENPQSTVVSDFEPVYRKSTQYQSEAEMEHDFISQLKNKVTSICQSKRKRNSFAIFAASWSA